MRPICWGRREDTWGTWTSQPLGGLWDGEIVHNVKVMLEMESRIKRSALISIDRGTNSLGMVA